MFSSSELERIGARAAPLAERMEVLGRSRAPIADCDRILATWMRAVAPGDRVAFERRLEWDGWSIAAAERALCPTARSESAHGPEWLDVLRRVGDQCGPLRKELTARGAVAEESLFEPERSLPFLELCAPFLRVARELLEDGCRAGTEAVEGEAWRALERHLLDTLAFQGVLAFYERFSGFRAARAWPQEHGTSGKISRGIYRRFVHEMLGGGLVDFFLEYSTLARLLCRLAVDWAVTTREFVHRLRADHAHLEERLGGGSPLGAATGLEPGLSDRHRGGRQVMTLTFAGGLRVVYKPRDVRLENAVTAVLDWLAFRGVSACPRGPVVLVGDGYGWIEFVPHRPVQDAGGAAEYFRRAGALLAVAFALGADDLHSENVIAGPEGPVVIDAETLLQPLLGAEEGVRDRTVVDTQLLVSPQLDVTGAPYDIGGLAGGGGYVAEVRRRSWRFVNTDSMHCVHRVRKASGALNRVLCGSRRELPQDHSDELVAGFQEAYETLLRSRCELLDSDGPLEPLAESSSRVLFRTSGTYGVLLYRLTQPRYQRDGIYRSFLIEALARPFARVTDRPGVWPWVRQEMREIEALDVPYLTVRAEETEPAGEDGEPVRGLFGRSGFEAMRRRIERLSHEDMLAQSRLIRDALARAADERGESPLPEAERLLGEAVEVGEAIRERYGETKKVGGDHAWLQPAFAAGEPLSLNLYDGACGVGLFLAALAHAVGSDAYRELAERALEPVGGRLDGDPAAGEPLGVSLGACSGVGGIVYALALAGSLMGSERYLAWADRAADLVEDPRLDRLGFLDVADGSAGALLGLTALHEKRPREGLLRHIRRLADDVLAGTDGDEPSWRSASGFAHGPAGVASALARAFEQTGDAGYADRALVLMQRAVGDAVSGAPGSHDALGLAWCRGASGLGLALLSLDDALGSPQARDLVDSITETIIRSRPAEKGDVCCGNCGRVELLAEAALVLERRALARSAWQLISATAPSARRQAEGENYDPGFFCGLAGVGYSLLRLARPGAYPSVAAFRPLP